MKKSQSNELFEKLESIRNEIEGVEYWSARDLQELFNYTQWRNFEKVIQKAAISVENTSESLELHFAEVSKSYILPNGGEKIIKDYALTRYACYLVAQNGDPNKEEIAFAQSYFATETRKQELVEKCYLESERIMVSGFLCKATKISISLISCLLVFFLHCRYDVLLFWHLQQQVILLERNHDGLIIVLLHHYL